LHLRLCLTARLYGPLDVTRVIKLYCLTLVDETLLGLDDTLGQDALQTCVVLRGNIGVRHIGAQDAARCRQRIPDHHQLEEVLAVRINGGGVGRQGGESANLSGGDAVDFGCELGLLKGGDEARRERLDGLAVGAVALGEDCGKLGRQGDDRRAAAQVLVWDHLVGGLDRVVLGVLHELDNLRGQAQGSGRLFLVPVGTVVLGGNGSGSPVVDGAQDAKKEALVAQAHGRGLGSLQGLENQTVHIVLGELADDQLLPLGTDGDAGALKALDGADDILPVLACAAALDNVAQGLEAVGQVVAVEGLEGQLDVADGDIDRLGVELGVALLGIDELLLVLGQVGGQQDLGVERGQQRRQLGRRGRSEDGQPAAVAGGAAGKGTCAIGGGRGPQSSSAGPPYREHGGMVSAGRRNTNYSRRRRRQAPATWADFRNALTSHSHTKAHFSLSMVSPVPPQRFSWFLPYLQTRPRPRPRPRPSPAMDPDQAAFWLSQLIGKTLRIHASDGRVFVGTMKCTDKV
jgi:hypothetical protein